MALESCDPDPDNLLEDDVSDTLGTHSELRDRRSRPALPSLTSSASVPAGPTTALSHAPVDAQNVISTREGSDRVGNDDNTSVRSGVPTLKSMETDLTESLSQVLLEGSSTSSANKFVSSKRSDADAGDEGATSEHALTSAEVEELSEEEQLADFLSREKHFLMLSAAGKPIYSRNGSEQIISGYMGIIQAIMGFYQDATTPDTLQSFSAPDLQVVLIVKGPIYLVAISRLGESEETLRAQLDFLYEVVVSSVTSTSMARLFDRGDNFDLGRLLSGSEQFMDKICDQLTSGALHLDVLLSALSVLRLRATLRARINHIMANYRPDKRSSLLYGMIAVNKKLASVLRPKGHSLYPADLRLLFETVWERGFEEGQDYWLPLCLPKFNSTGYLHVFVSLIAPSVAIILLSADKDDFFELQGMKTDVLEKLEKEGLVRELIKAKFSQVSTKLIGIEGLVDHFIFKSREHVQYISPDFDSSSTEKGSRGNTKSVGKLQCVKIYEALARSSGPMRHKLQIRRYTIPENAGEVLALSWTTRAFEMFVISRKFRNDSERIKVHELIGAANVIHQFVRREEGRVWVDDGVTF